ncbi:MAG: hypothetical protein ACO31Z_04860 [Litorivicinaceae bacterium]
MLLQSRHCIDPRASRRASAALMLCVGAFLWFVAPSTVARSAFPMLYTEPTAALRVLQAAQGDVLLVMVDAGRADQRLWQRLSGRSRALLVTFNGETLGPYVPDALLRVTPRTGVNRLQVTSVDDPTRQVVFVFSMLRSAGVPNQVLIVQDQAPEITVTPVQPGERARIVQALRQAESLSLEETVATIKLRGNRPIPSRPVAPNWRSDSNVVSADSTESGSDDATGARFESTPSVDAPATGVAPAEDTSVDSAVESTAETTESDVSADRRSYF